MSIRHLRMSGWGWKVSAGDRTATIYGEGIARAVAIFVEVHPRLESGRQLFTIEPAPPLEITQGE